MRVLIWGSLVKFLQGFEGHRLVLSLMNWCLKFWICRGYKGLSYDGGGRGICLAEGLVGHGGVLKKKIGRGGLRLGFCCLLVEFWSQLNRVIRSWF